MRWAQIEENKHRGSKDEEKRRGRIYKNFRDLRRIEFVKLDRKDVLLTAAETLTQNPNAKPNAKHDWKEARRRWKRCRLKVEGGFGANRFQKALDLEKLSTKMKRELRIEVRHEILFMQLKIYFLINFGSRLAGWV